MAKPRGSSIAYITYDFVLKTHDEVIEEYGGLKGLLNEGLLRSALEMPKARFNGRDLHRTIYDKVSAYLFHIIKNHPFVDGNKRTASMIAMVFFASNSSKPVHIVGDDYQDLILGVAKGTVTKKEIAKFFRNS